MATTLEWTLFNTAILILLGLDLFVFHRKSHRIEFKEAISWSAFWISLALAFNLWIYYSRGAGPALDFLAGYLIEESLSVDNLFVFLMLFNAFCVPAESRYKVLFWGIIGAIVLRAIFIIFGIALVSKFHWILYVFGFFLIYVGIKMALKKEEEVHPENNPLILLVEKYLPITKQYHGDHFFIRHHGKLLATPLFIVLLAVESTDVIFALDSIPAVMAITLDPYIVYTSNILAILGLRSLYFALAGMMDLFHHLHYGLAAILIFVGIKMLVADYYKIPIFMALGFIVLSIAASIIASLLDPKPPMSKKTE